MRALDLCYAVLYITEHWASISHDATTQMKWIKQFKDIKWFDVIITCIYNYHPHAHPYALSAGDQFDECNGDSRGNALKCLWKTF